MAGPERGQVWADVADSGNETIRNHAAIIGSVADLLGGGDDRCVPSC